ncbi:MAG: recombinase RecA [Planctomycetota bacterium]
MTPAAKGQPTGAARGEEDHKRRQKAVEATVSQIQKQFGEAAVRRLGDNWSADVEVISTGCLSLDHALGCGGMPRGRIVEVYGPESSGKTTLTLHVIANAQRNGGIAAFIDAEHAFDPTYARKLGIDLDNLLVSQPDCGEQALEICEMLVSSQSVDVVVIDSVAALVPRAEIEGNMGDSFVGLQARLMSQALRKLTSVVSRTNTCVIFINQIREKIGVMFGSPETTTGGRALKFYASVRLDIRRIGSQKQGDDVIGNRTRVKVVKNKMAPPFRRAEFDIMFNKGISWCGDVLDLAVEHNIVRKSGSWYSHGETRLGQGRDRVVECLETTPELRVEIESRLIPILFPPPEPTELEAAKTPEGTKTNRTPESNGAKSGKSNGARATKAKTKAS